MRKNEIKKHVEGLKYNELVNYLAMLKSHLAMYNTQRHIKGTAGSGSNPKAKDVNSKVLQMNNYKVMPKNMDMVKYAINITSQKLNNMVMSKNGVVKNEQKTK